MKTVPRNVDQEAQVVSLRQQGYTNNDIAMLLRRSPQRIAQIYTRWKKEQKEA